jgi:carbon storage regulator
MLVLTRRANQTVMIGSDITISVMEIRGSQVRIGVSAPDDVSILRGEVLDKSRAVRRTPDRGS